MQNDASKLCTIYDSRDSVNPIFDGQSLGVGTYRLHCYCDCENNVADYRGYCQNDGMEDVWEVTKLS